MTDPPPYSCRDTHDTPDSIRVRPGETNQLTGRFGDTATLDYACHWAGHYQEGMRDRITAP
jgi:uncharacterized cupredoxin-like copper-binding protein